MAAALLGSFILLIIFHPMALSPPTDHQSDHDHKPLLCGGHEVASMKRINFTPFDGSGAKKSVQIASEHFEAGQYGQVSMGYFGNSLMGQCVAIKIVNSDKQNGFDELFNGAKVLREVQTKLPISKRKHIIEIFEAGTFTEREWLILSKQKALMIMELGTESLLKRMYEGKSIPFDDESFQKIAHQLVQPLRELHEVATHLDIKPANYIYVEHGTGDNREELLKLIDFDGAELLEDLRGDKVDDGGDNEIHGNNEKIDDKKDEKDEEKGSDNEKGSDSDKGGESDKGSDKGSGSDSDKGSDSDSDKGSDNEKGRDKGSGSDSDKGSDKGSGSEIEKGNNDVARHNHLRANQRILPKYTFHTKMYAAPEMFDHSKFTTKADIWSVGMILYEVFFIGTKLNHEQQESPEEFKLTMFWKMRSIWSLYHGYTVDDETKLWSELYGTSSKADEEEEEDRKVPQWFNTYQRTIVDVLRLWNLYPKTALLITNVLSQRRRKRMSALGIMDFLEGKCYPEELSRKSGIKLFNRITVRHLYRLINARMREAKGPYNPYGEVVDQRMLERMVIMRRLLDTALALRAELLRMYGRQGISRHCDTIMTSEGPWHSN